MFLFFSGMDRKPSKNANNKLIQGKNQSSILILVLTQSKTSDIVDLAWRVHNCNTTQI